MGYYSQVEFDVRVRKDKIEEIRKEIERLTKRKQELTEKYHNKEQMTDKEKEEMRRLAFVTYWLEDMKIDEEGYIEFDEYYRKAYRDEDFVKWFSKYADKGAIRMVGEDGEQWGYWFDGEGLWGEIKFVEAWVGYYGEVD